MKKPEILDKPVHIALIKPSHLEQLAREGRVPAALQDKVELPKEQPKKKSKTGLVSFEYLPKASFNAPTGASVRKQTLLRTKLKVIHESVPDPDPAPPCSSCVAVCCKAFLVRLTEDEYESGLYGEYAVKFSPEMLKQLRSGNLAYIALNGPSPFSEDTQYVLDGMMGEPCPFLDKNDNCSIYEHRPTVCRAYSCVGDDRVTQEMRDGTEPILSLVEQLLEEQ